MKFHNTLREQSYFVFVIWGLLAIAFGSAVFTLNWSLAFIALVTFALSLLPVFFANRFGIRLPQYFSAAVVIFIFATIFLGEAFDFYERYWWWDILLHGGSAVGFGLVGFVVMLMLFQGNLYAAPAWAISFFAFSFAMSIGGLWEIFEFAMDQLFGLSMQKSGLTDTMWDLIVDAIGATTGAAAGFVWLKRQEHSTGLSSQITEFVEENQPWFRKFRPRANRREKTGSDK